MVDESYLEHTHLEGIIMAVRRPNKVYPRPLARAREDLWPSFHEAGPGGQNFVSSSLKNNLEFIKNTFRDCNDAVIREFRLGFKNIAACIVYLDGMVDKIIVQDQILRPLMIEAREVLPGDISVHNPVELVKSNVLAIGEVIESGDFDVIIPRVISGDTALFLDGYSIALILGTKGFATRTIEEPVTEALIRGPREGFIENIRANTALLRRRLRDPRLKIKMLAVGRRSRTDCALVYLEGVVKPELVKEVETRLQHIDVDGVLETGYLEQFIEDSSFSPFPQIQYTERPDKLIASVMEGRIGILLDGTPFGLIVPATFSQFFQSPEDYYERWIIASLSRALRIFASYLATFTPAVYVAIASYHPGLIPTPLALAIAATRQAVPFPVLIEVLIMEGAMELLREAGARLPRPIGETVSIVGAIVMGEAAIRASLISPIVLIVVAMTAIASFSIPSYNLAIGFRMLRFPMIFLASVLGLYGVMLGFIVVNVHMVSLKSFGRVYLASFIPYRWQDFKDLILRAPLRTLRKRPELLQTQDKIRQVNRKRLGW